ncbi:MAG: hypothetical protein WC301_02995 [Candidatus Omnitrophota bacterium]|jgi:chromosome segregation ATPase
MNLRRLKSYKVLLAALLLGVTGFSIFKYLAVTREKYSLMSDLGRVKEQVLALEQNVKKEKELQETLSRENLELKGRLETELKISQDALEQITEQIALAKIENIALREEKEKLALELSQVMQERDDLKVRLSSIRELKRTIREVKVRMRKAKTMMKEITGKKRIVEGNRGYLMIDGKSTFPGTKIRIEVTPASLSK